MRMYKSQTKNKKNTGGRPAGIDMTHGSLADKLILFSLPLIAANMLQLLFNAADVIVVGRFAGSRSLAAVGSTTSAIFFFINVLLGLSVGVNVMVARYLGMSGNGDGDSPAGTPDGGANNASGERLPARRAAEKAGDDAVSAAGESGGMSGIDRRISRTVHTAVAVGIIGGLGVGLLGILAAGPVLRLMSVPDNVFSLARLYMMIYFAGTPFNMLYNYGAAALRAQGDTRRPLLYLSFSGVLNVLLNLFFVIVLRMDVAGVALATIMSQGISAALVLRCLARMEGPLRFSFRNLCVDLPILGDMARIGVPAGFQMCLFSVANMTVQGAINSYGSTVMAGSSASTSIESFMYASMNALHMASQTFTSQNVGAGRYDRVDRVVRICLLYVLAVAGALAAVMFVFRFPLLRIYNTDPEVVQCGVTRLVIMVTPYFLYGMADVFVGAIRGTGHALSPVIATLLCTCLLRIVWTLNLDTARYGVEYVYYCFPVSWLLLLIVVSIIWHITRSRAARRGIL